MENWKKISNSRGSMIVEKTEGCAIICEGSESCTNGEVGDFDWFGSIYGSL